MELRTAPEEPAESLDAGPVQRSGGDHEGRQAAVEGPVVPLEEVQAGVEVGSTTSEPVELRKVSPACGGVDLGLGQGESGRWPPGHIRIVIEEDSEVEVRETLR
jgi:hypothetical protein